MERKMTKAVVKVLKGQRNYQTNFIRTKQYVLSPPWAVPCYCEYLTSLGKHCYGFEYNLNWMCRLKALTT